MYSMEKSRKYGSSFQCHLLPPNPDLLHFHLHLAHYRWSLSVYAKVNKWMKIFLFSNPSVLWCRSNSNNHTGFSLESDIENWKFLYFHEKSAWCQNRDEKSLFPLTGCCKSWNCALKVKLDEKFMGKCVCSINYYHHSAVFHLHIPLKAPSLTRCEWNAMKNSSTCTFSAAVKHEWNALMNHRH